ncbi:MAG: hypothetical protein NVSMB52_18110 [Chloroflexota bacterium]
MIFPVIVALVALSFSSLLLYQFIQRRRVYHLVWGLSLLMGALAAFSFILFLLSGRDALFFCFYYIFGGLLMAPSLGMGTLYLLAPSRWAHALSLGAGIVSVIGVILLLSAPVDLVLLHGSNVEAGTGIITGPGIGIVAVLNTLGAVAVIGGACYSAWSLLAKGGPSNLVAANVLIASGTIVASLAGALARLTREGSSFWFLLAVGFILLFAGYLFTLQGRGHKERSQMQRQP